MSGDHQILVSAPPARRCIVLAALAASMLLAACGQKGPLFLPTGEAAVGRRTLPQTLTPVPEAPAPAASAPASTPTLPAGPSPGTASPVRQP
jgi:predicted small lipoprotein YifL